MKINILRFILFSIICLFLTTSYAQTSGYFTDGRDGHKYKYVTIGEQVWMAENLSHRTKGSSVYLHGITAPDSVQNNEYYGRLYSFETALKACPDGWHLPTDAEWTVLIDFLGGEEEAGGKMKTIGNTDGETGLWNPPNKDATNESGFSAVPGGYRMSNGYFSGIEHYGVYWSSTKDGTYHVWCREFTYQYAYVSRFPKSNAQEHSVRCIKD